MKQQTKPSRSYKKFIFAPLAAWLKAFCNKIDIFVLHEMTPAVLCYTFRCRYVLVHNTIETADLGGQKSVIRI